MRVDYQVGLLYEEGMKQIVSSADNWKAVCRMTGRLYRYEFDNILMVYMQRPNATLVADYVLFSKLYGASLVTLFSPIF